MIYLHVFYTAKDERTIRAFYDEIKTEGIISETQKEDGNIRYDYFFSANRKNELFLLEQWENQTALTQHSALPHMQKLAAIKKKYEIETIVEKIKSNCEDV